MYFCTMKDKKPNQQNPGTLRSRKRQSQVEAGAYDGRFRTRAVRDKRAEQSRRSCRSFRPDAAEGL